LTGFGFSPQIAGIISVVDKMVPFLCSPPNPDGKISPFQHRIEGRDRMSGGRAVLSHMGWDNLEKYWGSEVRDLLEIDYPNARKIILVCDNLNTHTIGAFYAAFFPAEASRLVKRLEIHHTPKRGRWLNIAEIELSALSRQCLDQRLDNLTLLMQETKKGETSRNNNPKPVDWQFTSKDARIKLKRLYPQF
jgi:hypothetical protein